MPREHAEFELPAATKGAPISSAKKMPGELTVAIAMDAATIAAAVAAINATGAARPTLPTNVVQIFIAKNLHVSRRFFAGRPLIDLQTAFAIKRLRRVLCCVPWGAFCRVLCRVLCCAPCCVLCRVPCKRLLRRRARLLLRPLRSVRQFFNWALFCSTRTGGVGGASHRSIARCRFWPPLSATAVRRDP